MLTIWLGYLVVGGRDGIWSEGYFVSTVGAGEGQIKKYIRKQGEEDFGQAELEM